MVAVADREGEVEFESQYRRKDGTCFPIHIHVTSVRDAHGDVRYRISTPLDISELKRAERQLLQAQRMEAVGQLTGGIAHDFNNLLSIVIGNLDLAAERATNDPALLELIQSALTGAERGGELVRRLLAFARKQPLRPQPLDLNAGLPNVVALLRRTLGESIVIRSAPAPVLWPALVDAAQLDDAIVNLAINARDAMPAGGTLTIETADARLDERYAAENAEVTAGDYVMLAVSDTGTGMPPEVAQRAFEPFFTTKGESKGTGLGLSMVYGFVKQSGGHAKIYSELGHGTTVKLYLPRAETGRNETAAERASDEVPARGNEAILVVDDNADVRRTVVKMLHDLGYRIHEAERAGDALEVLRRGEPVDLLFTDIVMPGGMSGYELAREARALRPALKVVFTSGYAEAATRNGHALEPGERLLGKPYRKSELARKLREALDAPLGDTRPGSPEPGSR
jgi:signal transduction histidine kinase/ActR/RegA family two-component response regulator